MAAPDTNLERQKRWHRWPLIGIGASVAFGILMMVLWLFGTVSESEPQGERSQIEERSGEQSSGSSPAHGQEPAN